MALRLSQQIIEHCMMGENRERLLRGGDLDLGSQRVA